MSNTVEHVSDAVSTKTSIFGGGVAVVGGLTFNEWLSIIGVSIAIVSCAINFYYKRKRDKREQYKLDLYIKNSIDT